MANLKAGYAYPLLPSKLSIWGVLEFQNSRIPEFQNPEFWDPGVLDFLEMANLKAAYAYPLLPSKWSIWAVPEFQNSRIRILEFWNSGIPEMGHFEGLLCFPLITSKWSIWGVQGFKNSRIPESGILEFRTARLESGVDKDAKKSLIFFKGPAFLWLRIDFFCENRLFS